MMVALGNSFLESARSRFAALFARYGLKEAKSHSNLNGGLLVASNERFYLTVSCDLRDRWVAAAVGHLIDNFVPPPPIAPPTSAAKVREIPGSVLAWLATGDKQAAFSLGSYEDETPGAVDAAVERVALAMATYGSRLLDGDENEWRRAAELTFSRNWPPS